MSFEKIAFLSSDASEALEARDALAAKYGDAKPQEADVIVALGGDGLMLQTLHDHMSAGTPIYGMNRGSVGFLMNDYASNDLIKRLERAETAEIHPLRMIAYDKNGKEHSAYAVNEVSLLRQRHQAAKLRISVDNKVRMDELICDGILIATPAGSTAYNLSAYGPILPIDAQLLALTPISAFRPRRWRGALLPQRATVKLEVLEADKRPVSAVADHTEFRDVVDVEVSSDPDITMNMLFDEGHSLEERVLREQFLY